MRSVRWAVLVGTGVVGIVGCKKSPTLIEGINAKADQLKIPTTAGEPCVSVGLRAVGKSSAIVCDRVSRPPNQPPQVGPMKSFAVECKGPQGVHVWSGVAACDVVGNAAGDRCAPLFSHSTCDGNKLVSCAYDIADADGRGKVEIAICKGPKGCHQDDLGLPACD